jgi:hypothetical protein
VLDALVDFGFERTALKDLPAEDQQRAQSISNLLGLLDNYPVDDANDTLVNATLARIDRYEENRADRMNMELQREQAARGGRRIVIPDFITVAAVILIAFGLLWPIVTGVKQKSLDLACENNLRLVALGLDNYASSNNGVSPMATAGLGGGWGVRANSLNMSPLVDGGYCQHQHLNCPGHQPEFGPSYSYRWQMEDTPLMWQGPRVLILIGDGNPISAAARAGRVLPPLSMSLNHGGRGQNVLSSDGATLWLFEPVISRSDNIWLPDGVLELRTGAQPADQWDTFLAD